MIDDMLTVMWKERKGLLRVQGSRARTFLSIVVPVLMMAILLPLQMGEDFLNDAWSLLASIVIPLILIGIAIPQAFAGERERHTLETLLASRLPDRAILFGKIALAVVYGWGVTLGVLLMALIPVNIMHWSGRIMFYEPGIALAAVVVSFLVSGMIASLGVLISLRSSTAQGAQQALISVLLVPLMLLQIIPFVLMSVVPDGEEILKQMLSVDLTQVVLIAGAVLVVANVGLLLAAMSRFQRSRLSMS